MAVRANRIFDLAWDGPSRTLYGIAEPGGVFRMSEEGTVTGLGGAGLSSIHFKTISPDPRNPAYLLAGSTTSYTGVYHSEDGGGSWTNSAPGLSACGTAHDFSRAAEDPDVIWVACGYNGLAVTVDGGRSWTQVSSGTSWQVAALSADAALVSTNGLSLHRISAGTLEQVRDIDEPSLLHTALDGSIIYGHSSYELHRSTDGGQTFTEIGLGGHTPTCAEVDPSDPDRIYAGFSDDLFESTDGGASWSPAGAPFPVRSLALDPESGELFVGTDRGGIYRYTP
jgi:photosystem II stability/assembly factor-like uncharacterized protein